MKIKYNKIKKIFKMNNINIINKYIKNWEKH